MITRRLSPLLRAACRDCDMAFAIDDDFGVRFQKLRDAGALPRSVGSNARPLSTLEIATAVLSLVPTKPGFAGLNALGLRGLLPVGGTAASFRQAKTFGEALATLFESAKSADDVLEVKAYTELHGAGHNGGSIVFKDGDGEKTAHYVSQLAVSLLTPGKEKSFNPRSFRPVAVTEVVFSRRFFVQIARPDRRADAHGRLCCARILQDHRAKATRPCRGADVVSR